MKLKNKFLIAALAIMFAAVSCTDEDSFNNEVFYELENGGFVRFVEAFNPLIGTTDPGAFVYDAEIEDANGNLSGYNLYVVSAGDTFLLHSFTDLSGPVSINITAQNVAAAIGGSTADFQFGQTLRFIGEAIRNDGVVFDNKPLSADFEDGEFVGSTQQQLYTAGYRNALAFNLIIACPTAPDASTYAGNYTVVSTTGSWFPVGTTATVVAGPGSNQITMQDVTLNAASGASGTGDWIVTLNSDQTITYTSPDSYVHGVYGPISMRPNGTPNFTFECSDHRIVMRYSPTVAAGTFTARVTTWEKN